MIHREDGLQEHILAKPKKRKTRSALWLAIHGWIGLPMWAFLFFICLTGSVATISEEIVWLIEPAARSNPPSSTAETLGYDELVRRVEAQEPGIAVMFLSVPVKKQYALQLYVGRPNGSELTLYVNPYTGVIQGEQSTFNLRQLLRELHGWLLIPFTARYSVGWYMVSAMSFILMGSLVTGLVVYKKFWRAILRPRLRLRSGARIFWGDLHRLIGVWCIPFILIISVSAMWFLVQAALEDTGYKLPGEVEHPHVDRSKVLRGATREAAHRVSVDQAIEIAKGNFPGLNTAFVDLPTTAYDPIEVGGRSGYPLIFEMAYIDPYSGKVLAARGVRHHSAVALFTESMRPLHTGDFVGLWLKLLYFAFGLLLSTMVFSGMMIWTKRSIDATARMLGGCSTATLAELEPEKRAGPPTFRIWLRGWFHIGGLMAAIPLAFLASYIDAQSVYLEAKEADLRTTQLAVGPWELQLQEVATARPFLDPREGMVKSFRLVPCTPCVDEIRAAYINLKRPGSTQYGQEFEGNPYRSFADMKLGRNPSPDDKVWLTVEGWNGAVYQENLPLSQASPITSAYLKFGP